MYACFVSVNLGLMPAYMGGARRVRVESLCVAARRPFIRSDGRGEMGSVELNYICGWC